MNLNAVDQVEAIYNLNQRKIPDVICRIIAKFAVPIMWCESCEIPLQINYKKDKPVCWYLGHNQIKCNNCCPSLQDLYKNRKIKTLNQ